MGIGSPTPADMLLARFGVALLIASCILWVPLPSSVLPLSMAPGPSTEADFFKTLERKSGDLSTREEHHTRTIYEKFYAPDAPGYSKAEIAANEPEWPNGTKVSKDVMVGSVEPTRKAYINRSAAQQLWFS